MTRVILSVFPLSIAACLAVMPSIAIAEYLKLAPEGRGLLPKPSASIPAEPSTANVFKPDPSGGLSRTVFETDEDPNLRLIIRDYSFPADGQLHTLTLAAGALVNFPSGPAQISIAEKRLETPGRSISVPPGAPIDIVNTGKKPVVLRAIILETK